MRLYLYYIGKPRDPHANALAEDFVARTGRWVKSEMREIRPERTDPWQKHPAARKVLLDPAGREMDSQAFAALVAEAEMRAQDLVFLLGGHDGLPASWRGRPGDRLALSRMTYPHELARVVLAEQIYRAFTILRGHPYPR